MGYRNIDEFAMQEALVYCLLIFSDGVDPRGKKAWIGAPLCRDTPVFPFFLWHENHKRTDRFLVPISFETSREVTRDQRYRFSRDHTSLEGIRTCRIITIS